jgi:hypothetical protein
LPAKTAARKRACANQEEIRDRGNNLPSTKARLQGKGKAAPT